MKHEVYLDFTIADFEDITHDEITQRLGINPKKIYIKGAKKYPESSVATFVKTNRWIMGSPLDEYSSFESQMIGILDIIESKIDLFKPICEKYYCEFSCAIFLRYDNGESIPWIHLDSRYNRIVKELNIEFDIDLYQLPDKEE
jgi:Domain of unknown function (DUF4279)